MKTFFVNNNSDELILFFLGWGMDERPLLPLKSKRDVLYLYDYSNLDYDFDFSKYNKFYMIGYSAGVSVGAYLKLPKLEYSVAINGVYVLCDKKYGLKEKVINVFKGINTKNYIDFRRNYLVTNEDELKFFNKNTPLRTIESSMQELYALNKYPFAKNDFNYDKVFASKDDKIFNIQDQLSYWGDKATVINGGHFPFCNFKNLDEIISTF